MRSVKEKDLEDSPKEKKLGFAEIWKEICRKQKGLMMVMVALAVAGVVLLVVSLTTLRPQNAVVIVGYGDVYGEIAGLSGGYRRDVWYNMLAFPLMAVVLGFIHNLMILRVYKKYGKETALVMAVASLLMVVGVIVVIFRLLGEW